MHIFKPPVWSDAGNRCFIRNVDSLNFGLVSREEEEEEKISNRIFGWQDFEFHFVLLEMANILYEVYV